MTEREDRLKKLREKWMTEGKTVEDRKFDQYDLDHLIFKIGTMIEVANDYANGPVGAEMTDEELIKFCCGVLWELDTTWLYLIQARQSEWIKRDDMREKIISDPYDNQPMTYDSDGNPTGCTDGHEVINDLIYHLDEYYPHRQTREEFIESVKRDAHLSTAMAELEADFEEHNMTDFAISPTWWSRYPRKRGEKE